MSNYSDTLKKTLMRLEQKKYNGAKKPKCKPSSLVHHKTVCDIQNRWGKAKLFSCCKTAEAIFFRYDILQGSIPKPAFERD